MLGNDKEWKAVLTQCEGGLRVLLAACEVKHARLMRRSSAFRIAMVRISASTTSLAIACAMCIIVPPDANAQAVDTLDRSPNIGDTILYDLEAFAIDAVALASAP